MDLTCNNCSISNTAPDISDEVIILNSSGIVLLNFTVH